jgi:hypothetical protein
VTITSWTSARIPGPRCRLAEGTGGAGSGLLVDEELARAVRCESALAVRYWWGASELAVWHWRKALDVPRYNGGSARLHRLKPRPSAEFLSAFARTPGEVERRRRVAREKGLCPNPPHVGGRPWTAKELALLGKLPDDVVVARIGRTETANRVRRLKLKRPTARDRRRR